VLGHTEPTFRVDGHHYALVCIEGLKTGSRYEFVVRLNGERPWPVSDSGFPPSRIRTLDPTPAAVGRRWRRSLPMVDPCDRDSSIRRGAAQPQWLSAAAAS
jgi:hypothetical protein